MIKKVRAHWQRELIYLGLATMETCWLYPWLLFVLGAGEAARRVPFIAPFAMLLSALYLTRLLDVKDVPLLAQRLVTVALAILSTLLLLRIYVYTGRSASYLSWLGPFAWDLSNILERIPPSLILFIVGLYLWWRGISLAQRNLDVASAGLSFRIGIVAFFWLFLVRIFGSPVSATVYAFVYFFVGLIVIALSRVQEVSRSHVGIRSPFNASWMFILVSATFTVSALNLLATRLLSLRSIRTLLQWLHPVFAILNRAAYPVWVALAVLLDFVLTFLIRMFSSLFSSQSRDTLGLERLAERLRELQPTQIAPAHPPLALQVLKWGFIGFLFLGTLALLALSISRGWRALQEGRLAEHEPAWEEGTDRDVHEALQSRLQRLRQELQARLSRWRGEEYALTSIRQIYASLTRLAASNGFPRREAETPYEYIADLCRAFPESTREITLITDAYVRTRYGQQRFRPEYVQQIREAWLSIHSRQEQRADG